MKCTAVIEKDGFSVVAPIITSLPLSTKGRNTSCCFLLKRWISSRKRMVGIFALEYVFSHSPKTVFTSSIPQVQHESVLNGHFVHFDIIYATVVFPQPGGPTRMKEGGGSRSSRVRTVQPSPNNSLFPCPSPNYNKQTFSWSNEVGRNRSASGFLSSTEFDSFGCNVELLFASTIGVDSSFVLFSSFAGFDCTEEDDSWFWRHISTCSSILVRIIYSEMLGV